MWMMEPWVSILFDNLHECPLDRHISLLVITRQNFVQLQSEFMLYSNFKKKNCKRKSISGSSHHLISQQ